MCRQNIFHWIVALAIVLVYVECLPLSPAEDDDIEDKKRCLDVFEKYPDSQCILFDDEHCDDEDWVHTLLNGTRLSFGFHSNFFKFHQKSDDGESVSVRQGCTLKAYKKWNWSGEKYDFVAYGSDLHVTLDEVEGSLLDSFDDAINSMVCTCQ